MVTLSRASSTLLLCIVIIALNISSFSTLGAATASVVSSVLQSASPRYPVKIAGTCTAVALSKRRFVIIVDASCSPLSEGLESSEN